MREGCCALSLQWDVATQEALLRRDRPLAAGLPLNMERKGPRRGCLPRSQREGSSRGVSMGGGAQGSQHQADSWVQGGARSAALYGAASCGAACSSKKNLRSQSTIRRPIEAEPPSDGLTRFGDENPPRDGGIGAGTASAQRYELSGTTRAVATPGEHAQCNSSRT